MTNQLLAELEMANRKLEEKGKEIERLNNIIKLKTDFIHDLLEIIYYSDDTPLHSKAHLIGEEYEDKLKELKEKSDI